MLTGMDFKFSFSICRTPPFHCVYYMCVLKTHFLDNILLYSSGWPGALGNPPALTSWYCDYSFVPLHLIAKRVLFSHKEKWDYACWKMDGTESILSEIKWPNKASYAFFHSEV